MKLVNFRNDGRYLNLDGETIDVTNGSFNLTTTGTGSFGGVVIPTIHTAMTEPTGFVDRVAILSFVDGTRTFTITGNHDIYINGVKTTKTTDDIILGDTTGTHWIYYDVAGTLSETTGTADFSLPLIASVYYNTTVGFDKGLLGEERHGIKMDVDTHTLLHYTVGTRWESGLTGTFTDTTFDTTSGIIDDEDIAYVIGAETTCDVIYKDGAADFVWLLNQTKYYYEDVGSDINYNNGNALTPVPANQYVAYWIFATNSITKPIVSLMGQRIDTNIANARLNNRYESLELGTLPFQEMKLLYRVILRNDATPYEEAQDLRSVSNLPAGTYIATAHNILTGLTTGDDHTQYWGDTTIGTRTANYATTGDIRLVSSSNQIELGSTAGGDGIIRHTGTALEITANAVTSTDDMNFTADDFFFYGNTLMVDGTSASVVAIIEARSNLGARFAGRSSHDAPTVAPQVLFYRSRDTIASPDAVQDNDRIGTFSYFGHDGTDWDTSMAAFLVNVDGAVATGSVPSEFVYEVMKPTETSRTVAMKIRSSTNVEISAGDLLILSGNMGVGTATPALLSGTSDSLVEIEGTQNPGFALHNTDAANQWFYYHADDGGFYIYDAGASANRFEIDSSGNIIIPGKVGIGTPGVAGSLLELAKIQSANDVGEFITFAGGAAGTTNRGFIGYTHTGSGSETLFIPETADYMGIRGESGIHFGISSNVGMTLTSTGLGIGRTPTEMLDVYSAGGGDAALLFESVSGNALIRFKADTDIKVAGSHYYDRDDINTSVAFIGLDRNSVTLTGSAQNDLVMYTIGAQRVHLGTNSVARLTVDSAGHIYQPFDNAKRFWGLANDASLYYDATNFVCNPKEVGTGSFQINGRVSTTVGAGAKNWDLGDYTEETVEHTGTVEIHINGSLYRLLTIAGS